MESAAQPIPTLAAWPLYQACESALAYLTNPNYAEPREVVSQIVEAMVLCGADRELLESCAKATWTLDPLMASAPELLAALKTILEHVEDMDLERLGGNQCTLCHTYRMIGHDAIARAEGRDA